MSEFKPHEAPVNEAQALPVALPGKLVGRETVLAQVYAQLKANNPVLVHGPVGSGKTALAATLASAYAQQPGGVLWMNVTYPALEELLVRVGRAYQLSTVTGDDNPLNAMDTVTRTLSARKPFIVIDGAIQGDVASRFISRCVSGMPVLILNEDTLQGPWTAIEIPSLTTEQATALYKQESRLDGTENDATVGNLVGLLDNSPLGIVVAARAMIASKKTPAEFAGIMQQVSSALNITGPDVALTTSFRTLTGALQGLLLMMGATFTGRIGSHLLSMVSGAPHESVVQAMNILAQLNLVGRTRRYGEFYYVMHPLTHEFAQESLEKSNRLDELQTKVLSAVLSYARQYSEDSEEAHNKLATEMEMFIATAHFAAEEGKREVISELVTALRGAGDFVDERGYLYEVLELRKLSGASSPFPAYGEQPAFSAPSPEDMMESEFEVDEDALEEVDDDEFEESLRRPGSVPKIDADTSDVASLRAALAQARQETDTDEQVSLLKRIGEVQVDEGMENEAIATYTELLNAQEDDGENEDVLDTLDMLSSLMAKTENSQAAVMHATRGVKLADELDDKDVKMHLLKTLGDARQQLGESEQAIEDYEGALEIARMSDDQQNEAIILYKLGYAQLDNGDTNAAVQTWERALALFKSQEKRDYEGRTLGGLGSAYGDMDRWAEAVNFHTSALYIAREVNDMEEVALQLNSLAYAATQANQLGEAVLRYRQALHLAYESEKEDDIVSIIVDLARLLLISRKHVTVAELLVNDAVKYDPNGKDIVQLKERVESEKALAESYGTQTIAVSGNARDYAENAYQLLED